MSAIAASLRTVAGIGLPPLRPIDLRFYPGAGVVEVRYDPGDKQEAIRMPATTFGAFLVSYCVRARIPLPRLADKVIRINASSITLCCKTIFAEAPAPDDATGGVRFCRIGL